MAKPAAWRRWLGIMLRAAHLGAVTALGAALMGAPLERGLLAWLVLGSGGALLVVEWVDGRIAPGELAGAVSLAKLLVLAWMAMHPEQAAWWFWPVLFVSALSSHAPRVVRHWPGR